MNDMDKLKDYVQAGLLKSVQTYGVLENEFRITSLNGDVFDIREDQLSNFNKSLFAASRGVFLPLTSESLVFGAICGKVYYDRTKQTLNSPIATPEQKKKESKNGK